MIQNCSGNYAWSNEDKKTYNGSWMKPYGKTKYCSSGNWCFDRPTDKINAPYVGQLETYARGGYNQDFSQNFRTSLNRSKDLAIHQWIDKYTRVVFVEFSLYNPNVNLFSIVTLAFEVSSSGSFNPESNFLSIRLYNYVGNFRIFVVICQLIFLVFLCFYTFTSIKSIAQDKRKFFVRVWSVYDFIIVIISWAAVAVYFVAVSYRQRVLHEFREDPTKYVSFHYGASWQMFLEYMTAALVFMVSLKFLRIFQFNRRMFLLSLTLSSTASDLFSYIVVFSVILTAFSMLYNIMLHAYNLNFVHIIATVQTLLRVLLGKSDVLVTHHQFPVLESVVLFFYMCLMKFVLLNVFVAILNDGFSRAREKNKHDKNSFELLDFTWNVLRDFLGVRRLHVLKNEGKQSVYKKQKPRNVEHSLLKLERQMEKLLTIVESDFFREFYENEFDDEYYNFS